MRKQRGLSLIGLIFVGGLLFFAALVFMKALPAYIEYFTIKKHISELAKGGEGTSPKEIQMSFDRRGSIDDITSVSGRDLEVTKQGDSVDIRLNYSKKVPLFGQVSLCFDFDIHNGR